MLIDRLKHNWVVDSLRIVNDHITIWRKRHAPIVLVHAMPKTGGTAVDLSLKRRDDRAVFHVHSLDRDHIEGSKRKFKEKRGFVPYGWRQGEFLRDMIDSSNSLEGGWKIITLVREPVARFISLFFQTGKSFYPHLIDEEGHYVNDAVAEHLSKAVRRMPDRPVSRESEWFAREIRGIFGVDIFDYPFDQSAGWRTIRSEIADFLVMRLESLTQCFSNAIGSFLGTDGCELVSANVGSQKEYAETYQFCKRSIRLPRETLRVIYGDRFCRHFYSAEMIDGFVEKWGK